MFNAEARKVLEIMSYAKDIHPMLEEDRPFQSHEAAHRFEVGRRKYESALQDLAKIGWLKPKRGPRGGYNITVNGKKVDAWDVLDRFGTNASQPFAKELKPVFRDMTPSAALAKIEAFDKSLVSRRLAV